MTPPLFFACVLFAIILIVLALTIAGLIEDNRQTRRIFAQFERDQHDPTD